MKTRTTLTVEKAILEKAHERNLNVSKFLENALRAYLDGKSLQQPQPEQQTAPQLEQPNQPPKKPDLASLMPPEALNRLRELGFNIDEELLKRVIRESVFGYVVELDMYGPILF